jgi:HAD superfamily hydrolase (TIGR01549 family)
METLDYLSKKYELVVLTNFFTVAQETRLKRFGIRDYFKEVYGADDNSKPNKAAYIMAANKTKLNECLFVGDNLVNDYERPIELGMEAIWLTKEKTDKRSIKNINDLRRLL